MLLVGLSVSAQTVTDALTFGQYYHGGTARYMSMGGAFNALGGDFSTLSVNPAGLGVFRSDEFSLSFDLQRVNTGIGVNGAQQACDFLFNSNESLSDVGTNFDVSSVGYVSSFNLSNEELVFFNFGIGLNRLKSYNKVYRADINGASHSLTDSWSQFLKGSTTGAYLADQSYLMNRIDNGNGIELLSPLIEGAKTDYIKDVVEQGDINEWVMSFGGNVNNTVYFGATLGIQDIKQKKEYFQTEYFLNTSHDDPFYDGKSYIRFSDNGGTENSFEAGGDDSYTYYSYEQTTGVGLNGKFGVLVRPIDALRIGFAVHTPTINYLNVSHYADITNNTKYFTDKNEFIDPTQGDAPGEKDETPASYGYRTVSPYKLHAAIGITLGKRFALDAEADMVDYSTMKIKDSRGRTHLYEETNNTISEMYKVAWNTRIGAEFKLLPSLALRAGAAYYASPFDDNFHTNASGDIIDAADYVGGRFEHSIGLGFRAGDFFMDFAYIRSLQNNKAFVYDDAIDVCELYEMDLNHEYNNFMLTFGFKF